MLTDKFLGRLACIAAAAVFAGSALDASAGVIVQQRNFELSAFTAPLQGDGLTTTSASTSLSYQRWDPALGTLTGAQWILSSWLVGAAIGHVSSTSTDPNALAQGEVDLRLAAGAAALHGTAGSGAIGIDHRFGFDCITTLALGTCDLHLDFAEAVDGQLQATDLAAFEGPGAFDQPVFAYAEVINTAHAAATDIESSGGFSYRGGPDAPLFGRLMLVYQFDEPATTVPEPSAAWLAGLGLMTAAGARARRRHPGHQRT